MPLKLLNDWRGLTPQLLRIEQIAFNSTPMAEISKKDFQLFFNRVRTQSPCASHDLAPLTTVPMDTIVFLMVVRLRGHKVMS